jgi:hypothetical protein
MSLVGELAEVIEIEQGHAGNVSDCGIDLARDCDLDDQEWSRCPCW